MLVSFDLDILCCHGVTHVQLITSAGGFTSEKMSGADESTEGLELRLLCALFPM